jgi:hypothetical protein
MIGPTTPSLLKLQWKYMTELEQKRSPRPILKSIGPINFFATPRVGGEGGYQFF